MAALSSTQSGNWSSSSTWGGTTPSDGDTFTINRGHKVTVNNDQRPTNGWGDVTLNGKLEITSGGQFRLNGRITLLGNGAGGYFTEGDNTTNSFLNMTAGSSMEIRGNNSDQHGIWMETQQHCQMILEGTGKNLNTAVSTEADYGSEYIAVDSAANWAIGDWVTVFNREEDYRAATDEGLWVHYVDTTNNRIYVRQFVSPTAEITKTSGTRIKVDNAKVFRPGYKIIFGTGSNLNTKTITSIKYKTNTLIVDSNVSGTVTGETIYQTGTEKKHIVDSRVQRKATTVSTAITANSTTTLEIGNASDISTGDVIIIDVNNDNDTNWDYDTRHTVSSKSGNTLTLDRNIGYNIKVGSLVHILTRDVKIHAIDESSDTRPFILIERWTSGSGRNRRVVLQDVWLKGLGRNTNSAYYSGLMQAGYASRYRDDSTSDGENLQSRFDSIVYESPNYRSSYTGINCRDSREFVTRNCTSYRTERGYWGYGGNYNWRFLNNYVTRNWYSGFLTDGYYEPYAQFAYFYATRSDDYGVMFHHLREQLAVRHLILLNHEQRAMYGYYNTNGMVFERVYMDGRRYHLPWFGPGNGRLRFLDSYIKNSWDFSSPDGTGTVYSNYGISGPDSRTDQTRTTGHVCEVDFYEHNFEYDGIMESWGGFIREWDGDQNAWRCRNLDDDNAGAFDSVYVAANCTVRLSLDVKLPGGSYTRPQLFASNFRDRYGTGRWQTAYTGQDSRLNSSDSNDEGYVGFREQIQFTSAADNNWETKTLTIQPRKYGYFLIYGLHSDNNIREEEFYMRDIKIYQDHIPASSVSRSKAYKNVKKRNTFTPQKKRISGRL